MTDVMPILDVGDWVRAREGFPELLLVSAVGVRENEPCVFDARGGALVFDLIIEVRKANGVHWARRPLADRMSKAPIDG